MQYELGNFALSIIEAVLDPGRSLSSGPLKAGPEGRGNERVAALPELLHTLLPPGRVDGGKRLVPTARGRFSR